jgi:hypothetical protein
MIWLGLWPLSGSQPQKTDFKFTPHAASACLALSASPGLGVMQWLLNLITAFRLNCLSVDFAIFKWFLDICSCSRNCLLMPFSEIISKTQMIFIY